MTLRQAQGVRRKVPTLVQRAAATEKTMQRYRHRAFDWSTGATCLHLARTQMKNMGHKPPAIPKLASALAAERALKARGCADLAALLDSLLPRIAPAEMLVGDIAMFKGEPPFDAICVNAGAGMLLGWHCADLSQLQNITDIDDFIGAWRL